MKKKYCLGNWKMNMNSEQITDYFHRFFSKTSDPISSQLTLGFIPQFVHIPKVVTELQERLKTHSLAGQCKVGVQDCSEFTDGAYTGQVSPIACKDMNVAFTLIGHSEMRQFGGDHNARCGRKIAAALHAGLEVVYCIGESLQERESHQTLQVLAKQLAEAQEAAMSLLNDSTLYDQVIFAYEPLWAIGTGVTPSTDDIDKALTFIAETYPQQSVLYGGSVSTKNINEINTLDSLDGILVGGASLKAEEFGKLYQALT